MTCEGCSGRRKAFKVDRQAADGWENQANRLHCVPVVALTPEHCAKAEGHEYGRDGPREVCNGEKVQGGSGKDGRAMEAAWEAMQGSSTLQAAR